MKITMKKVCKLINKYRDGELDPAARAGFEAHLTECAGCRQAIALLNNLVHILRPATPDAPPAFSERVARMAFERGRTWDFMVVSWLRPATAWVALAFCILITSLFWISPTVLQPVDAYGEYEVLSGMSTTSATPQIQTEDFDNWLEGGGR
jgi:anti-sigma factor RsiW